MSLRERILWLALGALVGAGACLGALVVRRQVLQRQGRAALRAHIERQTAIEPHHRLTDPEQLIEVWSTDDVAARRQALTRLLFGDGGYPTGLPEPMEDAAVLERYHSIKGVARAALLRVRMEHGIDSILVALSPVRPTGRMVFYHSGHEGEPGKTARTVSALLGRGHEVIVIAMPLYEHNPQPLIDLPRFGKIKLFSHDHLLFVPVRGHPLKLFIEPVAVALNHAQRLGHRAVDMIGLSGGGWTTTLSAALDERIRRSYPVAGSLPIYLRYHYLGDYEQLAPEVYRIANYLELYVLGAAGPGRRQLQVLNLHDPCCMAGRRHTLYEAAVASRAARLKGSFAVHLNDRQAGHLLSDEALSVILGEIEKD